MKLLYGDDIVVDVDDGDYDSLAQKTRLKNAGFSPDEKYLPKLELEASHSLQRCSNRES